MKKQIIRSSLRTFAIFTVFAAAIDSWSAIITTDDGNGADAYVWKGGNGNNNYGAATFIWAQDFLSTSSVLSFVRFDISTVSGTITDATLTMVATAGPNYPFYVWGLKDSQNADNWGEATITYNTAPGLDGTLSDGELATQDVDLSKADRLDDGTLLMVATGSEVSFSHANLDSFLNADTDGYVTFIIGAPDAPSDPAFRWASKDNTTYAAPTLAFEVFIPEPSTAILAGLGLMAVCLRRRRR